MSRRLVAGSDVRGHRRRDAARWGGGQTGDADEELDVGDEDGGVGGHDEALRFWSYFRRTSVQSAQRQEWFV